MPNTTPLAFTIQLTQLGLPCGEESIKEYNSILATKKKVWLAKPGNPHKPLANLELYANPVVDANVIVVMTVKHLTVKAYIASLVGVQRSRPSSEFILSFSRRATSVQAWFQLGAPLRQMSSRELKSWVAVSNGGHISWTLFPNTKKWTYFIACKPEDLAPAKQLITATYGKRVSRNARIRAKRQEELLIEPAKDCDDVLEDSELGESIDI